MRKPSCNCGACLNCRRRDYQREYQRRYREANAERCKSYVEKHKETELFKQTSRDYNKTEARRQWRANYRSNPEVKAKEAEYQRNYKSRPDVRERHNTNRRKYCKQKYHEDLEFKLRSVLRNRLRIAVRRFQLDGQDNSPSAIGSLGCSIPELIAHIESKFLPGMTWDNWTRVDLHEQAWNIDHVRPLSGFDLSDPEQVMQASHYTNLAPMWAVDNIRKSDSDTAFSS